MTTTRKRTRTRTPTTTSKTMIRRMRKRSTSNDLPPLPDVLRAKEHVLHGILSDLSSVIVAFSGGADSAYLAYSAASVLGPHALAVTADSASYPDAHRQVA